MSDQIDRELDELKLVNKRQSRDIGDINGSIKGLERDKKLLQAAIDALTDRIIKLEETLAGDDLGNWSFANMRSTLSNQALALKWVQGGLSLFGATTIFGVIGYVTGWGDDSDQQFVFLDTYRHLEGRVEAMELQNARWALSIEKVESQLELPRVFVDRVEQ